MYSIASTNLPQCIQEGPTWWK